MTRKITFTLEASSPAEAKAMMDRAYGEVPVTDDDIRDYLVRKGWWKPGVDLGPTRKVEAVELPGDGIGSGVEVSQRKNVSPGKPSISKIGGGTKDEIFKSLQVNVQPAAKYKEHLKLLWSRGEVKFDGTDYYL